MRGLFVLAAAALAMPTSLCASTGTAGGSPQLGYEITPLLAARVTAIFVDVSGYGDEGDAGRAPLGGFGGVIDVHPFDNGFRLSAGARTTGPGSVRFNGLPHLPFTAATSELRKRPVSPLCTVGYAQTTASRMTFGIDAGALFRGRTDAGDASAAGDPGAYAMMARQDGLLKDYDVYPVVQLSLGYTF